MSDRAESTSTTCPGCGYDLTGLAPDARRCPECARPTPRATRALLSDPPRWFARLRARWRLQRRLLGLFGWSLLASFLLVPLTIGGTLMGVPDHLFNPVFLVVGLVALVGFTGSLVLAPTLAFIPEAHRPPGARAPSRDATLSVLATVCVLLVPAALFMLPPAASPAAPDPRFVGVLAMVISAVVLLPVEICAQKRMGRAAARAVGLEPPPFGKIVGEAMVVVVFFVGLQLLPGLMFEREDTVWERDAEFTADLVWWILLASVYSRWRIARRFVMHTAPPAG